MTFRTFDIDNDVANGCANPVTANAMRNIRARRRSLAMRSRSIGCRINGFGV